MQRNPGGSTVAQPASHNHHRYAEEYNYLAYRPDETRQSRSPQRLREFGYQERPPPVASRDPKSFGQVNLRTRRASAEPDNMSYRSDYVNGHGASPSHFDHSPSGPFPGRRPMVNYVNPGRGGPHPGQYESAPQSNYMMEQAPYSNINPRPTHQHQYPHVPVLPQANYYPNPQEQIAYIPQPQQPTQLVPQSTQLIPQQPQTVPQATSQALIQPTYDSYAAGRSNSLAPNGQYNPQWAENQLMRMKMDMEQQQREMAIEKAAREAKEKDEEERKKKAEEEAKHARDIAEARKKEREEIERQRKADEESRLATAKAIQEARLKAQQELEESIKRRQEEERIAREKEEEQREKIRKEFEEKARKEAEAKEAEAQRIAKEKAELEQRIKQERENAAREAEEKQRAAIAAQKAEAEREAARQAAIDKRIEEEKKAAAAKALEQLKAKQEREAKIAAEKAAEEKRLQDVQAEYDRLRKSAADERAKLIEENAKAKKEGEENAKKALKASEEAIAKLMAPPDKKRVIKFKDALGRKFSFPFDLCSTWQGMDDLIQQAFQQVPMFRSAVQSHFYDLIGPNGEVILPQIWDTSIEPDFSITMQMWAMDQKLKAPEQAIPGAQAPPPPPPPPQPAKPAPASSQSTKPRRRAAEPKRSVGVLGWVAGRPTKPTRSSR